MVWFCQNTQIEFIIPKAWCLQMTASLLVNLLFEETISKYFTAITGRETAPRLSSAALTARLSKISLHSVCSMSYGSKTDATKFSGIIRSSTSILPELSQRIICGVRPLNPTIRAETWLVSLSGYWVLEICAWYISSKTLGSSLKASLQIICAFFWLSKVPI